MKFIIILLLIPFASYSQSYTGFSWNETDVSFKTVKMNLYYGESNKTIFNGSKDASINIRNLISTSPTDVNITAKLGGYFEIEDGIINSFEYKVKDYQSTITYTVISDSKMIYFSIYYDEISKKPNRIFVSATKNYLNKKEESLTFILTGFE